MQKIDSACIAPEAPETLTVAEINRLIDLAVNHMRTGGRRYNEHTLFFSIFPDTPESHVRWLTFLHDVRTCPSEMLEEARRILATRPMAQSAS